MRSPRPLCSTPVATATVLALALTHCGPRGDTSVPPPVPPPPTPTAAEPALALPTAPAGVLQRTACSFGERRDLGSDAVLGVFVDRATHEVSVVRASGARVEQTTLDTSDGTLRARATVLLPAGAQGTLAWRSSAGEPMLAYRLGTAMHLARIVGGALVESAPVFNTGDPSQADEWLGPLDDPNDSRFVGLVRGRHIGDGRAMTGTLCMTDTVGMRALRCQYNWANGEPFRSLHPASGGAVQQLAHGEFNGVTGALMAAGMTQNSYSWVAFGPAQGATTPTYARGRTGAVIRAVNADMNRGGVFLAMAPVTGVAFYAEALGPLHAQLLDSFAQPVLDPVRMPFVEARWLDAAYAYGEVFATLSTRADRDVTPHTTTLLRLHTTLPADAPITTPPLRAPLGEAKLLPLEGGEILLYSLSERAALVARCGVIAP